MTMPPPPPPGSGPQPAFGQQAPFGGDQPTYGQQPAYPQPPGYGQQPPPGYAPPGYQAYPAYQAGGPNQFGPIAGFGSRLGAWLLDGLLYGLLMILPAIPGVIMIIRGFDDCTRVGDGEIRCFSGQFDGGAFAGGLGILFLGVIAIALLYIWQLATKGQTWGRQIVGIKVINERTGEVPGWGKAIGRTLFAGFVSSNIFYIGYLWMLWDDKKQTLHDKVAGTHVIEV